MRVRGALLAGPLGFGTAPLGNMYRDIAEDEALATVDAAWDAGTRFLDTAPLYGAGLAEIRLGKALSKRPRSDYVLSSKVGRLILDEIEDAAGRDHGEKGEVFKHGRANRIAPDYSADGTMKSIEDSLERMKIDHVDFVWVHDIAQEFHGDHWLSMFESARTGASEPCRNYATGCDQKLRPRREYSRTNRASARSRRGRPRRHLAHRPIYARS
jgi:D-threo-aldose 1-dehydrogenase